MMHSIPPLLRRSLAFLAAAAVVYAVGVGALVYHRAAFIYPFAQDPTELIPVGIAGMTRLDIPAEDGIPLTIWLRPAAGDRPTLFFFGGNGGQMGAYTVKLAEFAARGYGIAMLNYRGSNGVPGAPSERALIADALALYDRHDDLSPTPAPPGRRVIYGQSLGAAVAAQLAARRPAAAVVLETPFARLCEVAEGRMPYVPACLILPDDRWDTLDIIRAIDAPLLILHGDADRVVPLDQGARLFGAAAEPKEMVVYPGGRHADLRLHGAGAAALEFIDRATTR